MSLVEELVGAEGSPDDALTDPAIPLDLRGPRPGQRVGRYRLLFPIAAGGMAEVWAAKPEGAGLSRTVAIKVVRPEYAADEAYSRMFIDEAMVAAAIHHPNICETFELGRESDLLYMALEWVPGESLGGLIQGADTIQPLPDAIAARICADACAGLHAAHEAVGPDGARLGVVHRDVSPPNILVSIHGQVKVIDFGIAKARNQLHARTRAGSIQGKLAYIPPEQVLGQELDRRADVYALGVVLYVATLGRRPFGSGTRALGRIMRGGYRTPSEVRPGYPKGLEAVIVRALSSEPSRRYQTAEEMRSALEHWLLSSSTPVCASDVERVVRERIGTERRDMIGVLMSTNSSPPQALAHQFLHYRQEEPLTPTGASGIVLQPEALRSGVRASPARKPDPRREQEDDLPTLVGMRVPGDSLPPPPESERAMTPLTLADDIALSGERGGRFWLVLALLFAANLAFVLYQFAR